MNEHFASFLSQQSNSSECAELEAKMSFNKRSFKEKKQKIGFLASKNPPLLSLKTLASLIEEGHTIFMERSYGHYSGIADIEYADIGVELLDSATYIANNATIIVKYSPLSKEEFLQLSSKTVVISEISDDAIDYETSLHLLQNMITGIGYNHIETLRQENQLELLRLKSISITHFQQNLSDFISKVLASFLINRDIKNTLQLNPEYLKGVYCYQGHICHKKIAEYAQIPWKNIIDLCWNWN